MRLITFLFIIHAFQVGLEAQWSLRTGYAIGQSDQLEGLFIVQSGPYAFLEYGFRLKSKRIEFHPGIGYRAALNAQSPEGQLSAIELDMPIAVYPFDFGGDCNCPTFSKDGELLKKGFFLELQPGLSFQRFSRTASFPTPPHPVTYGDDQLSLKIGLAAGLDIGLSDRWTLTPMIAYSRYLPTTFGHPEYELTPGELTDQAYLMPGLRLTTHPDDRRRRSRR